MEWLTELKRRILFRVALFYVVSAWLIIEVAETVLPLRDWRGPLLASRWAEN